jgi:4-hydroxyphenylpyruvate dioxygenase
MAAVPAQDKQSLMAMAKHQRLLPGDGIIDIERFVDKLKSVGYQGPVGIEVFNDALKRLPPEVAARHAWQALKRCWG